MQFNLYKLYSGSVLLALLTAQDVDVARARYTSNGGTQTVTQIVNLGCGYPPYVCSIYF